jgi:large subunit ribosomal protein L18
MKYRMIRKRRRNSTTNYSKRIALLKSGLPRVVVRKSNRGIVMQIVEYSESGDKVIVMARSAELVQFDWQPRGNIPTAYLTGCLLAKKAKQLKASEYVLDTGLYKPMKSSVIFAAARGSIDSGLKILNSIEIDSKRLSGGHIASYANALKEDSGAYKRQFAGYTEKGFMPENIQQAFEAAKKKITGA